KESIEKIRKKLLDNYKNKKEEILEKRRKTCIERFGVDSISRTERFRKKIKKTSMERIGSENPAQNKEVKLRQKHTMLKKYGVESNNHMHLDDEVVDRIKDKEFLYLEHVEHKKSVPQIAEELGVHPSTIRFRLEGFGIPIGSYFKSQEEDEIYDLIKSLGVKAIRSDNKTIYPHHLDILIPNKQVAFEYNGLYWHSSGLDFKYPTNKHQMKAEKSRKVGVRLYQIFENEWRDERTNAIWRSIIENSSGG